MTLILLAVGIAALIAGVLNRDPWLLIIGLVLVLLTGGAVQ